MSSINENLASKLLILTICLSIFFTSIPVDNTAQSLLSISIIGILFILNRYVSHIGLIRVFYLCLCVFVVLRYLFWRIFFTLDFSNDLPSFIVAVILFLAEAYGIYMFLLSCFVSLRPIERTTPPFPSDENLLPSVDVFIPSYDEDQNLLTTTLLAALNIRYPKARDTFASLKKTCRKHGLSFWDYLKDRLLDVGDIPPLSEVIRAAAACG